MTKNIWDNVKKIEFFKSKTDKSTIGIDVGSYAIKLVELVRERDKVKIKNLAYKRTDGLSDDRLPRVLKELVDAAKITNKQVNTAVSGPSVVIRLVELPRMSKDELKNSIPFEAEKYIPFNIDEVVLDHQLLQPHMGVENKMLVLLVAAKKDSVRDRVKMMGAAGLTVELLDVGSFANVNAFFNGTGKKVQGVSALIDIGASSTDINILDEGILYFSRNIQLGGNSLTKVLSDNMSLDFNAAEEMKLNPGARSAEIEEKVHPVLHNIIDEVRLSFSYFENRSGKGIEKAFMAGGGGRMRRMTEMFKDNLGVEAEQWDPAAGIEIDPAVDGRLYSAVRDQLGIAIGLALR